MVRAKFTCIQKTENEVRFQTVTNDTDENKKFWKYTPLGDIYMHIDNEKASEQFEQGKEYYVDFTPANN